MWSRFACEESGLRPALLEVNKKHNKERKVMKAKHIRQTALHHYCRLTEVAAFCEQQGFNFNPAIGEIAGKLAKEFGLTGDEIMNASLQAASSPYEKELASFLDRILNAGAKYVRAILSDYTRVDHSALGTQDFIDRILNHDFATLYANMPGQDGQHHTVWFAIVFGNNPGELIMDWSADDSIHAALQSLVMAHNEEWSAQ
jgi:hypothetical protein